MPCRTSRLLRVDPPHRDGDYGRLFPRRPGRLPDRRELLDTVNDLLRRRQITKSAAAELKHAIGLDDLADLSEGTTPAGQKPCNV